MDKGNATKLTLGALLVGASALSGSALLGAVASGIGVNWASEALGSVVVAGVPSLLPGTPLTRAYERSIRRAVADLRREYQQQYGRQANAAAFTLVSDTASSVAQAEYLQAETVSAAQQELTRELGALLHGHEDRQVVWIKTRLLEQVARTFQEELASATEAWQLFHGWLIQATAQNSVALSRSVEQLPTVLTQLRDSSAAVSALHDSTDRLEDLLNILHDELQRIATGAPSPVPGHSHTQTIGGNAQVGTAISGDVHGPISHVAQQGFQPDVLRSYSF